MMSRNSVTMNCMNSSHMNDSPLTLCLFPAGRLPLGRSCDEHSAVVRVGGLLEKHGYARELGPLKNLQLPVARSDMRYAYVGPRRFASHPRALRLGGCKNNGNGNGQSNVQVKGSRQVKSSPGHIVILALEVSHGHG